MGEGAGVVVLEELEHARARREDLRRGDRLRPVRRRPPHHRPGPGRQRRLPLHARGAEAGPDRARPTSTTSTPTAPRRRSATRSSWAPLSACSAAIRTVSMSSTKSAIGHLLGAAGAVEAIFSIMAIRRGRRAADPESGQPVGKLHRIDLVPLEAKERKVARRCRIPSGSAAPTPAWSSASTRRSAMISLARPDLCRVDGAAVVAAIAGSAFAARA